MSRSFTIVVGPRRGMPWISVRTIWLAPRGDGRWRSTRAVWFSSTATSWPPSSFIGRGFTHRRATFVFNCGCSVGQLGASRRAEPRDGTLVKAPTARSRQAACRGPLIRLPGNAFDEPLLRVAPQAARDAHRGPCCVRLSAWWALPVVWPKFQTPGSVRLVRRPGHPATRLAAQLTSNRHRPVTRRPSAVRPTAYLVPVDARVAHLRMPWSAALAPRVRTPWRPRRHFTGHRLVAVPRSDGLRDKF